MRLSALRSSVRLFALALLVLVPSAFVGCAAPPADPITTEEALETFEVAWTTIYETHFDEDFNGADWEGLREELRPRVAEARTQSELRSILDDIGERVKVRAG